MKGLFGERAPKHPNLPRHPTAPIWTKALPFWREGPWRPAYGTPFPSSTHLTPTPSCTPHGWEPVKPGSPGG